MEISLGFILSAFFAGLLTFLAPCTLPLVPAYLGFISGVDGKALADPKRVEGERRKVVRNGMAFVVGFSLIFIAFGVLAGSLGALIEPYRVFFARAGGALVILFGLLMLGVLNIPFLSSDKKLPLFSWLHLGHPSSSFVIGAIFALGWTPCVGPVLGSILLIAGTSGAALTGGLLLSIFSLGLALPFLLIALSFSKATRYVSAVSPYLKPVSIVAGLLLIALGLLLLTGNFGLTVEYGFKWFDFLEYDRILDYL